MICGRTKTIHTFPRSLSGHQKNTAPHASLIETAPDSNGSQELAPLGATCTDGHGGSHELVVTHDDDLGSPMT